MHFFCLYHKRKSKLADTLLYDAHGGRASTQFTWVIIPGYGSLCYVHSPSGLSLCKQLTSNAVDTDHLRQFDDPHTDMLCTYTCIKWWDIKKERCKIIHTVGQWSLTMRVWPVKDLCCCIWPTKTPCDKRGWLLHEQIDSMQSVQLLSPTHHNGSPRVTCLPSVTCWKMLRCNWKTICLLCTFRLSNV